MPSEILIPNTVDEELPFALAFSDSKPQRDALLPEEILRVNLDVPSAVASTLGALPEILAVRSDVVKHLPTFDITHFDRLQMLAMSLSHAFARGKTSLPGTDKLPDLNAEATALRDNLLADMTPLVRRGLIHPDAFRACKGYVGYKVVATELQVLVSVARDNWSRIGGKCGITLDELDRAEKLVGHILRLVGLREQAPEIAAAAAEDRDRAFTLFSRSYDQIRRAVLYLRWDENDGDEIAPSLYGRRKNGADEKQDPAAPVLASPAPTPGVPTGPVAPPVVPVAPAVPTGGPFVD
jgi:hypothetical protein